MDITQIHKKSFELCLAEIRSISYEIVRNYTQDIDRYFNSEGNDKFIKCKQTRTTSVRQYKNKVTQSNLIHNMLFDEITNKIEINEFYTKTIFYEFTDFSKLKYNDKNLRILPQGPYYKYNLDAIDRCGLSYGTFITNNDKKLKFDIVFVDTYEYGNDMVKCVHCIYYCPIQTPY